MGEEGSLKTERAMRKLKTKTSGLKRNGLNRKRERVCVLPDMVIHC